MGPSIQSGQTILVSRLNGTVDRCQICSRTSHYGVAVKTERLGNVRELFVCFDCTETCDLVANGRIPCITCGGSGCHG